MYHKYPMLEAASSWMAEEQREQIGMRRAA
jgi:hypothetical protein